MAKAFVKFFLFSAVLVLMISCTANLHIPENYTPQNGFLGVETIFDDKNRQLVIKHITQNSPAANGGLYVDDIITYINSYKIGSSKIFSYLLAGVYSPGDKLDFHVIRRSDKLNIEKKLIVSITLGDRSNFKTEMARGGRDLFRKNNKIYPGLTINKDENEVLLLDLMNNSSFSDVKPGEIYNGYKNLTEAFKKESNKYSGFYKLDIVNYILNDPIKISAVTNNLTAKFAELYKPDTQLTNAQILHTILTNAAYFLDIQDVSFNTEPLIKFDNIDDHLLQIIKQIKLANTYLDKAFAAISPEEKQFLLNNSFSFLDYSLSEDNLAEQFNYKKLIRLTKKINYRYLITAATTISVLYDETYLQSLKETVDALPDSVIKLPDFVHYEGNLKYYKNVPEIGNIVIGGNCQNRYFTNATVIIEPDGDDYYGNNCGASAYSHTKGTEIINHRPTCLVIDFRGDDIYEASKIGTIATGILGIGALIDIAGNDSYNGDIMSIGSSFIGVGMLLDEAGNDRYHGQEYTEGSSFFGTGFILDRSGDDYYSSTYLSQGMGGAKGFGMILDQSGNDSYYAFGKYASHYNTKGITYGCSQGVGFGFRSFTCGGIGLLLDGRGDDIYYAGSMSQGIGYFFALGILNDRAGNDKYIGMRYAQGCGVHQAAGSLIDNGGNDFYEGRITYNQGGSWDIGAALFLDYSGDDFYKGANGQGVGAQNGFTLFRDYEGNDSYVSSSSHGQGSSGATTYHGGRNAPNIIFMIDSAGDDSYNLDNRDNHSSRINGTWGIFLDQ